MSEAGSGHDPDMIQKRSQWTLSEATPLPRTALPIGCEAYRQSC